jgi:hypothetical protein
LDIEASETNFDTQNQYINNLQTYQEFDNWDQVGNFIHQYSRERGFGTVKFRVEFDPNDKTIIRRRTFACRCSRTYDPKKNTDTNNTCNTTSTKTDCQWKATFSFPKSSSIIKLTSICDEHNHDLVSSDIAPQLIPQLRN